MRLQSVGTIFRSSSHKVWLIIDWILLAATVDVHGTISETVGSHGRAEWTVNWNLIVICTKSVSVGIDVVKQPSLQQPVIRWLYPRYHMGWGEGHLLCLCMEVINVLIQSELSNFDERVVTMRPYFSGVVDIKSVALSILKWHDLDIPSPRGEVSFLNRGKQVMGGKIFINFAHLSSFRGSICLDPLVSLEVVLDQECLTLGVHPLERVIPVSIHMTVTVWSSTVREENCQVMKTIGGAREEVEDVVEVGGVCNWVSLQSMDEVWEFDWVLMEEHRSVVSDHVEVAFLSVEFDCESSGISVGVIGATLTNSG